MAKADHISQHKYPHIFFPSSEPSQEIRSPLGMSWGFAKGAPMKSKNFIQTPRTAQECSDTTARQGRGKLNSARERVERLTEFAAPLT